MRKIVVFSRLFLLCNLSLSSLAHAKTLPKEDHHLISIASFKTHVPPPVLRAFQALLQEVADDNRISLSGLAYFTTVWEKEKNTYTVHAEFGVGLCEEGGLTYTLDAKFKANGNIILIPDVKNVLSRYVLGVITCIRLPI